MLTIKLINTLDFFQHRIKLLLILYFWQFVLIYINDIIIYFSSLNQHIQHFYQILIFLKNSDVTLILKKYHFAYLSIQILKHYVFKLELNIAKKKVEIIRQIKFPVNLKELKVNLNFFEYYKLFVNHFANIAKLLV